MLQSMGSQGVGHNLATEQQQNIVVLLSVYTVHGNVNYEVQGSHHGGGKDRGKWDPGRVQEMLQSHLSK